MIKKIILWSLLALILLVVGGIWHTLNFKPVTIELFYNRIVYEMVKDSPETLSSLRVLESVGIKGHQDKLDNASPEKTAELFEQIKEYKAILSSYSEEGMTEDEKLSKDILMYLLDIGVEAEAFQLHTYPLNQLFGAQSNFPSFMDAQHQVEELRDAEDYVKRMAAVKTKFSQILAGLKLREQAQIIPPRFVIERVLTEMKDFIKQPATENILYTSLKKKMEAIDKGQELTLEERSVLASAAETIEQDVYPAYQLFIDYFGSLADKASDDDGFWKLPQGDKAYQLALKLFTTTDYSPDYIHNLGLSEVARIQQEILAILAAEGRDVSGGFTKAMADLSAESRFYYPDTQEGREQILKDYQSMIDEISAGLDGAFRVRPEAPVEVLRIPEFKEKTAPGAYYQRASIDGQRPGRFYANLYDIKATPKYGMRTLAYHEATPGHHFQQSIQQELQGVPIFRKFAPFTAYSEGWALYAERLAWELGFQENPYDNIGRLQAELFRSVRLVVDTGIHAKRWTREQAIDYMLNNTGMAKSDVVSEIERYIVMPGQATSYKVGMIKILELREKAKQALGEQFDLRDFHDQVLKNGAVPLDILERIIDRYIEAKRKE
ncbi:DUF885 family protein [Pleionea sp. CnH1-48]|uniref:DUF885 domain-containing protein n=1 Tax=Pleionea sp. CnH1-48 TaxID=2954494 RepID=UPI002096FFD1|nr:DUF885 domain-containing protein [Pleionea sp. CnH1-48]MCO7224662.1 DUF885 domain-containing protein [Pleionea sp. CnH1-48]